MSVRMRVVGWNVQPIVMADDGDNLTPVNVGPQVIPAAQWEAFKTGGDARAIDALRAQVEKSPPPPVEKSPYPPGRASCGEVHPQQDIYHPAGHDASELPTENTTEMQPNDHKTI